MLNLTSPIDPAGRELSGAAGISLKTPQNHQFSLIFLKKTISGFAIDRSKKYIKTMEIDSKIDAVDPQAAADNPPPTPR